MKSGMRVALAALGLMALAMGVSAQEEASSSVRFKPGEIAFTILKSDGVTPVENAEVKIRRSARSKPLAEATTDKQGNAVLTLAAGQYVLNVAGRNIADLVVEDGATLAMCRVVLDDDKAALLLTGGAAGAAAAGSTIGTGGFTTLVVGGVAIMVAAGGGYAIYEHNRDSDKDAPAPAPAPAPQPVRRPSRTRPAPSAPPSVI